MKKYQITGMSCAACRARVEKAVLSLSGVSSCNVSLLTNSMDVEGTVSDEEIIHAVEKAGYGAISMKKDAKGRAAMEEDLLSDRQTPILIRKFWISLGLLLVLLYFSMGVSMLGWWSPPFPAGDSLYCGLLQMLLSGSILWIHRRFFLSGVKSACHGAPNMDTLVSLGSGTSFLWSVYALFGKKGSLYFESAAMILVLITVGKILEAKSKGKTTDALKALFELSPRMATVCRDGKEVNIPAEEVTVGDIFVVYPGGAVPVDGIVLEGNSAVDESVLTGESTPAEKAEGDSVYAATINRSGFLRCRATQVGENTVLSSIIRLVSDASATKAPIAKTADRVASVFVPAVLLISVVTFLIWCFVGKPIDYALARAVAVLVISCPCSLGLATPVAIMVGNGIGAKNGILFKTAISLEMTGRTELVVLDKTGTVTRNKPEVTKIQPAEGVTCEELLRIAYSLEIKSEHPLAMAIVRKGREIGIKPLESKEFRVLAGNGVQAEIEGDTVCGGSSKFMDTMVPLSRETQTVAQELSNAGCTPLFFARNSDFLGIIAVKDSIQEDSPLAVQSLKAMGLPVVLLTGDNRHTAKAVGDEVGIDFVIAGVLPEEKESVVRRLQTLGKVLMVGDGINDAPALVRADVGMAIGAGTDVAMDAADVVLMNSRLADVVNAIRLSLATLRKIRQNLFWAFIYNALCIPLAAGCFVPITGFSLPPMAGAAAMSLSSFCVVSNALLLNRFSVKEKGNRKKLPKKSATEALATLTAKLNQELEVKKMTKTMKIEGMMCQHCEARVKKTLEAIPGVTAANVSHTEGTAVITLSAEVDNAVLTAAVTEQGYQVLSVE